MSGIRDEYMGTTPDQDEIVRQSKAEIVVMRWGQGSGKDLMIDKLIDHETDFCIMPAALAADNAAEWEGRSVFQDATFTPKLAHYIKRKQKKHHRTKRIFLNECAFFNVELIPLIIMLQTEWPRAQIYLISTPRGGWKLGQRGSAGLEFDMICANLEMHEIYNWEYSRKFSPRELSDRSEANIQDWEHNFKAGWPAI